MSAAGMGAAGMRALSPITRTDFRRLSDLRLREAEALLAIGLTEGAYYLAGYAVECALKACICVLSQPDHFPPPASVANELYSHNLEQLLSRALLADALRADTDGALKSNWALVRQWSEQSRYNFPTQTAAAQLLAAVADPQHGVLPWLRRRW